MTSQSIGVRSKESEVRVTMRLFDTSVARDLVWVALGRLKADLVITGGRLVNVYTAEIYETALAIAGERIAVVGDVEHADRTGHRDRGRSLIATSCLASSITTATCTSRS